MRGMKDLLKNKTKHTNLITFAVVIVAYAIMQTLYSLDMLSNSIRGQLIPICTYIVLAVSLNLVVGISGELSLGHAGFMGVGAFTGVVAAAVAQSAVGNPILRLIIAMIAGGVMAGIMGGLIGIPVLRLRGDYLAIVTLAFGEILKNVIGNLYVGLDDGGLRIALSEEGVRLADGGRMILSGPLGATGVTKIASFPVGFALILLTLFVILNIINSKEGRAIKAIRDNRIAAESVGINVMTFKMKAFVLSAFLAGMAGALYGLNYSSIMASKFNFNTSINILIYVVLGGMGNINGSIIAAALITYLNTKLATVLTGDLAVLQNLLYALILIVIVIYNNAPALKGFRDKYSISAFIEKRKKVHDPSNINDDKAKWDVVPTKISMDEILSVEMKPQDIIYRDGGNK